MFERLQAKVLQKRILEPRRFLQVIIGPRQVGKTTLALQVQRKCRMPSHVASGDEVGATGRTWLEEQWEAARWKARQGKKGGLLVLDEVQKVGDWATTVKRLWDEDTRGRLPLRVVLLGSSALLVQKGLGESLAGRFERIFLPHWSFDEMSKAFDWNLETYLRFGGYPGAAPLIEDLERWREYIVQSLVETALSRDILMMTRIDKPALLRRLFFLGCHHSGQILSYQKMTGQLQDAGNTTTLAHYLYLLGQAGLLTGLEKYSGNILRQRGSSPKLQVLNPALASATMARHPVDRRDDPQAWGRLVESAVGAHLCNSAQSEGFTVSYWRDRNQEVDFVVSAGRSLVALEVKSGATRAALPGMEAFARVFTPTKCLLVGGTGIPLEEFLRLPVRQWL